MVTRLVFYGDRNRALADLGPEEYAVSQENVEVVRRGYEAYNRGDFDAALARVDDSIRWRMFFSVESDVLRGKEAVRAAWEMQTEALDVHVDIAELTPLDESRVLCVGTWRGKAWQAVPPSSRLPSTCSP